MDSTGGVMGLISLKTLKNTALGLSLLLGTGLSYVHAEGKDDTQIKEEMGKFSEENAKMREEHIQKMREVHLKHINDMYDRKLAHSKEMGELWKQLKPGDKEANKALKEQIKEKRAAFHESEKKIRKDFMENVLKAKNKEFQGSMKGRHKGMKKKHHE